MIEPPQPSPVHPLYCRDCRCSLRSHEDLQGGKCSATKGSQTFQTAARPMWINTTKWFCHSLRLWQQVMFFNSSSARRIVCFKTSVNSPCLSSVASSLDQISSTWCACFRQQGQTGKFFMSQDCSTVGVGTNESCHLHHLVIPSLAEEASRIRSQQTAFY